MFPAHSYPWGGMPYAHPIHQSPGFPYNMGAIPEVVPGTTKGGHAAMMTQASIQSSVPQQISHPGMPIHMPSPSMPVPIHPMGYDPRMMMMMGHPMMSPYGMHPGMMAAMMSSSGEGVEAAKEPPASPSPQVSNSKSARKNQGVRFNPEHMATPVPGHTPPHLAPTRGSFRYPGPPGASGASTAYTSPASTALPTPSGHSYPTTGGYFTFVPYGTGSAQPSPTRATGSYPTTPAPYNAKTDPFAMQAMASSLKQEPEGEQQSQRPLLSDARYGRSWYGGR